MCTLPLPQVITVPEDTRYPVISVELPGKSKYIELPPLK